MPPVLSICESFQLDLAEYARTGLRVGIWASSGRGKSFGVGVFCEELLSAGIPVIAIDPEGELHTLREQYRVLVLGGDQGDLPLPAGPAGVALALRRALSDGLGLVIDLSEHATNKGQQEAARPWLEHLWVMLSEHPSPAALVVEEVHIFAPQSGSATTADLMQRFAKQGRKRGAILVAASQRTQAVSKEFMSQLNFPAIGGFETERDYEAVKAVVDGHTFDEFRSLEPGRFYLPAAGGYYRWRPRRTSHGGSAPAWQSPAPDQVVRRDAGLDELVEQLRAAFAEAEPDQREAPSPDRARIKELEVALEQARRELTEAKEENTRLRIALQVAGLVKVQITQEVIARAPEIAAPAAAAVGAVAAPPVAKPAPATLADLKLPVESILLHPDVKELVRKSRNRARGRMTGASSWTDAIVKSLLKGTAVDPTEFASWYGYKGKTIINRIDTVLGALEDFGFATRKNGRYRVNEPYLVDLLTRG